LGATAPVALAACAPAAAVQTLEGVAGVDATAALGTAGVTGVAGASHALGMAGAAAAADQIVRVTIEVKKKALVDGLYDYLKHPGASRIHPVVEEFSSPKRLGVPKQLLEALVLEGDLAREDVDEFVTGLLDGYENLVIV
jgi:hypothetical protein